MVSSHRVRGAAKSSRRGALSLLTVQPEDFLFFLCACVSFRRRLVMGKVLVLYLFLIIISLYFAGQSGGSWTDFLSLVYSCPNPYSSIFYTDI